MLDHSEKNALSPKTFMLQYHLKLIFMFFTPFLHSNIPSHLELPPLVCSS